MIDAKKIVCEFKNKDTGLCMLEDPDTPAIKGTVPIILLILVFLGTLLHFVSLISFFNLHVIYLSGEQFNNPPLIKAMASLALHDSVIMMIGAFTLYMIIRRVNFMSLMAAISIIYTLIAGFLLYFLTFRAENLIDSLMAIRFVQIFFMPAPFLVPAMFCFSVVQKKYHHKISFCIPLILALSELVSIATRSEYVHLEIKSWSYIYVLSGLISFLCFLVAKNIKSDVVTDYRKKTHTISKSQRNIIKFTLFLVGFLFAVAFAFPLYFAAPYFSEILVFKLPGGISPLSLHNIFLIMFLPLAGHLYEKFGLLNVVYFAILCAISLAIILLFQPLLTFFSYLLYRVIFALSCSLFIAPLYFLAYDLSNKRGIIYKPVLWSVAGLSCCLALRSLLLINFHYHQHLLVTLLFLTVGLTFFILIIPKIHRVSREHY